MARDLRAKRMVKERENLEKENSDYACFFKDEDMYNFFCYIIGPEDSVYRHKLVKLQFEIPPKYPWEPPKVKFVQHRGERIHPNLYVEGKVCLSILGTWPGDPWAFGMSVDSVLITVRSLLDNHPYLHEPKKRDHPEFNKFVQHNTWRWLLLDYIDHETDPTAKAWLQNYLRRNGQEMTAELHRQQTASSRSRGRLLTTPYKNSAGMAPDYDSKQRDLQNAIRAAKNAMPAPPPSPGVPEIPVVHLRNRTEDVVAGETAEHPAGPSKAIDLTRPHSPTPQGPPAKRTKVMEVIDLT